MVFGKDKNKDVPRTVGLVEGAGVFICTSAAHGGDPFETKNPKEWEEHLKEAGHYRLGAAPCAICKTQVEMTIDNQTPVGSEPVCQDCKARLIAQ